MRNSRGFTLIELLAVIVIMGILMAIAIPSINLIIMDSRKDIYVNSARTFINEAEKEVVNSTFEIDDPDTTYYIHIANLVDDRTNLGKSGFATWSDSYVVATMNLINNKVNTNYYFNSSDMAKWKIELVERDKLKKNDVFQDKNRKVQFLPVGNRSKLVIYDKNGVKIENQKPYIVTSEEKAKKCFTYRESSDNLTITGYDVACGKDVVIPNAIGDKEVVGIADKAFANKGLTSVYISNSIKTISHWAFANNKLTTVTIPDSVETIGNAAFSNNYTISKLKLPRTLQTIGQNAFQYNALEDEIEVLVPGPNTVIGACAFCNNKIKGDSFLYKRNSDGSWDYRTVVGYLGDLSEFSNKTFAIPGEKKGVSLEVISDNAFKGMIMLDGWTVSIPSTVTSIGGSAFNTTRIVSVNLPNGLKTIGYGAFYNNYLRSLSIPSSVTSLSETAFNKNKVTAGDIWIYKRTASGIDYSAIIGYSGDVASNVVVPSTKNGVTLKSLPGRALQDMVVTGTLTLPKNVTFGSRNTFADVLAEKIDNGDGILTDGIIYGRKSDGSLDKSNVFKYTKKRTSNVIIPSSVKTISAAAFHSTLIKSVTIPEGVTSIGVDAFSYCDLSEVVIPKTVTSIGGNAFFKKSSSNSKLTKIVNKTGKSFNWKGIVGSNSNDTFETGTIKNSYGEVIVTKE